MSQLHREAASSGSALYCGYLKDELVAQDARKASFEQRGITVVTSAGALAALLFGLAALAATGKAHALPQSAKTLLVIAVIVFAFAGLLALLTNLPIPYDVPAVQQFVDRAKRDPADDDLAAQRWLAGVYAGIVKDAKRKNTCKGWLLIGALAAEIAAVALLAAAIAQLI